MNQKMNKGFATDIAKDNGFCIDKNMVFSDKERICWMRSARSKGISEANLQSLLCVYKYPSVVLEQIKKIKIKTGKKVYLPSTEEIEKEIDLIGRFGGKIVASFDPEYSKQLFFISDPPPVLTIIGQKKLLNTPSVAIVGARSATLNSAAFTKKIANDLASLNFNIVSGLALGVDAAAHSVIYSGFCTTAVMANGLNNLYPMQNLELYKKIAKDGLILTERPFGMHAKPQNFVRRNRIISGLCKCLVLVEAGLKSGSRITAQYAKKQGKKVFAVPGMPMDKRFAGCNAEIKNGAYLLESVDDILSVLKADHNKKLDFCKDSLKGHSTQKKQSNNIIHYEDCEIREIKADIMQKIDYHPVDYNLLMQDINAPDNMFITAIVELEIERKIVRYDGNKISLCYCG